MPTWERINRAPSLSKFHENFHIAKSHAKIKGKFLSESIQSTNFESYQLNWNIWSIAEIQDIVHKHFIFWHIYDHIEGRILTNLYNINEIPVVLIIDPYTW